MAKQSKPPTQKPVPPFCINCAHFIEPVDKGFPGEPPRCRKAEMLDLVSGEKFNATCQDFRHPEAPCGTDARMFEAKPAGDVARTTAHLPPIGS